MVTKRKKAKPVAKKTATRTQKKTASPRKKTAPVTLVQIRAMARHLVKLFHPDKVILFGAYAYGKPNPESDVDLLVVMPNDKARAHKNARGAQKLLDVPYSLNLLMHTSEEVTKYLMTGDKRMREIILRGQVLFERKARRK